MQLELILKLLQEFDYSKNRLEDTIGFLEIMINELKKYQ